MRKLILYYLYCILLIPITLRVLFGSLDYVSIHPGLFIHFGILFLLLINFIKQLLNGSLQLNLITKIIFGFICVYIVNLFLVEIIQFYKQPIIPSIEYTFKILLFLFLSHYIYQHHNFFNNQLDKILLINTIIFIANVIIGNLFQIGWQSYEGIENTYRGFLAGNDTSIFSFVSFGYTFYSIKYSKTKFKKLLYMILLIFTIYSIFIIATKAIFVAFLIVVLFTLRKNNNVRIPIITIIFLTCVISIILLVPTLEDRILSNYLSQKNLGVKMLDSMNSAPSYFYIFNMLAPGRIMLGLLLLLQQFNDSLLNILFGYGVSGIFTAFGRPPMAEFFAIIGYYGIFGFIAFYIPQLFHLIRIVYKRKFNLINVLFISIFLYGAFGGFLYGVTNTIILFSLVFSLSLYQINNKKYFTIK